MQPARVIGVLGAGTMGAGIAQLACRAGARTLLHDPLPEALERGAEKVRGGLGKEAAKGRLTPAEATAAEGRLEVAESLQALADCELVIEAAPERVELKRELYERLSEIVGEECVLATNTSSLPVTGIAAAASHPERVVGMHFFNPAPLMRLLEVVAGERSGERALALAEATGRAMGKDVIRASDVPGFLVNRCNRPFGLEALRLLQEGIAEIEAIDRICRLEGGFRMGPFELMDLVGVDTGFEISQSFYRQSFGEPRWRPSPIAARYAAAGLHGRKSGRGYYDYSGEGPYRAEDPQPLEPEGPAGGEPPLVVVAGDGALAQELRAAASAAGYEVRTPANLLGDLPALVVECDPGSDLGVHPATTPEAGRAALALGAGGGARTVLAAGHPGRPDLAPLRVVLCAAGPLATLDRGKGAAVGFHVLAPFAQAGLVELTRGERCPPGAAARAERFFAGLGKHTTWVEDAPGLVLGRIVCQLVNECAFALGEGVGSARDIDTGMVLGLNHPRGPLEWADAIGLEHVLAVLGALWEEYREERYRAAPVLRALVRAGRTGRAAGAGFFEYGD